MLSLTIFDVVRRAPARTAPALAATAARSSFQPQALVANDISQQKLVSGDKRG